nr:hypothetical protein CTI12_AA599500 [Tanacetum cinerariifolium]
ELETKDGITRFVPISKNKKPQEESEATDVDLTVLALESPPDGFMSLSDGPYAPLDIGNESMKNVSLLESHDQSARHGESVRCRYPTSPAAFQSSIRHQAVAEEKDGAQDQ